MPTRYLRAGIRDDEKIDGLSCLAETLLYRLWVTVDDYGRTDARPAMVKAAAFPIKESVTAKHCESMLKELSDAGLIEIYIVDGRPYIQMKGDWENAPRAKHSKFPAPNGTVVASGEERVADGGEKKATGGGNLRTYVNVCKPRTCLPVNREPRTVNREPITENRKPETENPRATRLPQGWELPDPWRQWANQERPDLDASRAADEFRDYWSALGGQRATKTDWEATWRNWVRRSRPPAGRPVNRQAAIEEVNRKAAADWMRQFSTVEVLNAS